MRLKSFTELAQHLKPYISVIRLKLACIVEKGKVTRILPGGLREYTHKGLSVAVDDRRIGQTVVTFLEDNLWKEWWKQPTKKKFSRKVVV